MLSWQTYKNKIWKLIVTDKYDYIENLYRMIGGLRWKYIFYTFKFKFADLGPLLINLDE
jgi:hypothetical protein